MRSIILVALLGIHFSYHEAEALNKECMTAMKVMMDKQTKLIVPCIESLGLTTGAEKKDKAMVPPHLNFNISLKHGDSIKLDLTLSAPIFITSFGIIRSIDKIKEFKENVTNFLQCIMKCVFVKGKMLAPDGSVDLELAQKMMDDLPDALKDKAADVIQGCGHHAASLDPNDASCESYRDFTECLLDISLKMCNN